MNVPCGVLPAFAGHKLHALCAQNRVLTGNLEQQTCARPSGSGDQVQGGRKVDSLAEYVVIVEPVRGTRPDRPDYGQRFADDAIGSDWPPRAAIFGVVSVITHHIEACFRHSETSHLSGSSAFGRIAFPSHLAINVEEAVVDFDSVARKSHNTLHKDVFTLPWRAEGDDLPARDAGQPRQVPWGTWKPRRIQQFGDQYVVPYLNRRLHRCRWYDRNLHTPKRHPYAQD